MIDLVLNLSRIETYIPIFIDPFWSEFMISGSICFNLCAKIDARIFESITNSVIGREFSIFQVHVFSFLKNNEIAPIFVSE